MFDAEKIFEKVDKMRLSRGWSYYRLSELSGMSMTTIYSWRDRKSLPTLATLNAIGEAFDVDPIVFLVEDGAATVYAEEERELLTRWSALNKEQKKSLMHLLFSFTRDVD